MGYDLQGAKCPKCKTNFNYSTKDGAIPPKSCLSCKMNPEDGWILLERIVMGGEENKYIPEAKK